jgi:hypothetical protein
MGVQAHPMMAEARHICRLQDHQRSELVVVEQEEGKTPHEDAAAELPRGTAWLRTDPNN